MDYTRLQARHDNGGNNLNLILRFQFIAYPFKQFLSAIAHSNIMLLNVLASMMSDGRIKRNRLSKLDFELYTFLFSGVIPFCRK